MEKISPKDGKENVILDRPPGFIAEPWLAQREVHQQVITPAGSSSAIFSILSEGARGDS